MGDIQTQKKKTHWSRRLSNEENLVSRTRRAAPITNPVSVSLLPTPSVWERTATLSPAIHYLQHETENGGMGFAKPHVRDRYIQKGSFRQGTAGNEKKKAISHFVCLRRRLGTMHTAPDTLPSLSREKRNERERNNNNNICTRPANSQEVSVCHIHSNAGITKPQQARGKKVLEAPFPPPGAHGTYIQTRLLATFLP